MPDQEAVHEGKKPIKRRLRRRLARVAYIAFHAVSLLLLLACIVAWFASYRGGYYNCEVDLYSLHRSGSSTIFCQKYALFDIMRGEATFTIGKRSWDRAPTVPFRAIHFEGEQVADPDGFMLPENGWHQFRHETYSDPPENLTHGLGNSGFSVAFPFWSTFVVLLVPPLIWLVRRASRKVVENRRGFAPILKA